ncbi:MAG: DHH family phosphoesterase [Oscillospiraceae bacterium]
MKRWKINRPDPAKTLALTSRTDLTPLCADVLVSRGISSVEDAATFFAQEELSDPFLLKDMQTAADILTEAAEDGERICVYGDYDCDGVTATAVLYSYLLCMGADAVYYIPERSEGYGLSIAAVDQIAAMGVSVIVTVDNGISAVAEAAHIRELGMRLVITDHHQPPAALPDAEAIVNPHRADCPSPFKELAGVGVALKLCAALDGGDYGAVLSNTATLPPSVQSLMSFR